MPRLIVTLVLCLGTVPAVCAHDFWLLPASFTPAVGKATALSLHVGDHFASEKELSHQKKATLLFKLISANGISNLDPREGDKPIARISPAKAGIHVVVLERDAKVITLEAKKFTSYLQEEGLSSVIADRKKRGEANSPGRERYRRDLSCYLRAGDKGDDGWKKRTGHKLEIVPLSDPTGLKKGDAFTVRVLFDAKPLAEVKITAFGKVGDKVKTYSTTTSVKGEAKFTFAEPGVHLIRLVHMRRATSDSSADWHSWWAAMTFEVK